MVAPRPRHVRRRWVKLPGIGKVGAEREAPRFTGTEVAIRHEATRSECLAEGAGAVAGRLTLRAEHNRCGVVRPRRTRRARRRTGRLYDSRRGRPPPVSRRHVERARPATRPAPGVPASCCHRRRPRCRPGDVPAGRPGTASARLRDQPPLAARRTHRSRHDAQGLSHSAGRHRASVGGRRMRPHPGASTSRPGPGARAPGIRCGQRGGRRVWLEEVARRTGALVLPEFRRLPVPQRLTRRSSSIEAWVCSLL